MTAALLSARAELAERLVLENGGMSIGYRAPGKVSNIGEIVTATIVMLVFTWLILGIFGGFTPDYLENPLTDAITDPLPNFIVWASTH